VRCFGFLALFEAGEKVRTWMGVVFQVIAMFMFSIWSTVYNLPRSSISVLLFSDHTKRGVRKTPGIEAVDSCIVDT